MTEFDVKLSYTITVRVKAKDMAEAYDLAVEGSDTSKQQKQLLEKGICDVVSCKVV